MTNLEAHGSTASKRRKIHHDNSPDAETIATSSSTGKGVDRPISPPLLHRARKDAQDGSIKSPIHLTRIKDMPASKNVDTISLSDILGDPSITACWCFNFLLDVDFIIRHFHPKNQDVVNVHIMHGFWKREEPRRIRLLEAAERYANVSLHQAWLPDAFGTHHSKMMVLVREGSVQVVIHTANMIERDWANMTQGVWISPLLPLLAKKEDVSSLGQEGDVEVTQKYPIGSGERFKVDLLRYLKAYGKRLDDLTNHLKDYDFSSVRAAFLGSVPSKQRRGDADPTAHTSFGWMGLREILGSIPVKDKKGMGRKIGKPNIVMQVSSIATLGPTPTWLENFQSVLSTHSRTNRLSASTPLTKTAFTKASSFLSKNKTQSSNATFNIIFPTAAEIRTSIDGYDSGDSIHMKLQSAQAQKQWEYLKGLFCHWKSSTYIPPSPTFKPPTSSTSTSSSIPLHPMAMSKMSGQALRGPAAPHIKTYIRFSDETRRTIDWALLTSANLSRQAWGDLGWADKKSGGKGDKSVWIQSYEVGVLVWPGLFAEGDEDAIMVPVFGRDTVDTNTYDCVGSVEDAEEVGVDMKDNSANKGEIKDLPIHTYQQYGSETENETETETEDEDDSPVQIQDPDPDEDGSETDHSFPNESTLNHPRNSNPLALVNPKPDKLQLSNSQIRNQTRTMIPLRMPYDVPLSHYSAEEIPWCASAACREVDWRGRVWEGF